MENTLYINGRWHQPQGDDSITIKNPATEEIIGDFPNATAAVIQSALDAATTALSDWKGLPAKERGNALRQMAEILEANANEITDLLVKEGGKPVADAQGEVAATVDRLRFVAQWDRRIEGDIVPGESPGETIHLLRKPYGVIAAITPWNYPLAVFVRKLAPALVTGNTLVGKPSEVTPMAVTRFVELIDEEMNLPPGVVNLVNGDGHVGEQLVSSPKTDMITMTGHVETGKAIMEAAAASLTPVSLELGGKAPAIVWKDADIDAAVDDILTARITNAGQVCTCAERVYVHEAIYDKFMEKYTKAVIGVTVGHPGDNVDMGPQVSRRELEKTQRAVTTAQEQGATIAVGGHPLTDRFETGFYFEPTVVTDVEQDMEIMHEEIFGPVTPVMAVETLDEAIKYANDSRYGLSSYLFTGDYEVAMRVAEELEFGETFINRTLGEELQGHHIGWGESGLGGEDGKFGVLKYTQLKTVYHNFHGASASDSNSPSLD